MAMEKYYLTLDDEVVNQAEKILDSINMDLNSAVTILLKKIIKEGDALFLFHQTNILPNVEIMNSSNHLKQKKANEEEKYMAITNNATMKPDMTKSKAIRIFKNIGLNISGEITFASKNRTANNYWANPAFDVLSKNWTLILNDWVNRILYLLIIPANSINESQLVSRNDKKNVIDLQIAYDDSTFTDNRSGFSFKEYIVAVESY